MKTQTNDNSNNVVAPKRGRAIRRWIARFGIAYLVFCAVKGIFWLVIGTVAVVLLK